MFSFGMQEILIILVVGLVLFGAKKLPDIGSGLGRAIHNFKRAVAEPDQVDITPKGQDKEKQADQNGKD